MTSTLPPLATTRDVTAALGRAAIGIAMVGVGWYQASDRFQLDDQAPWLALASAGLLVAAAGGVGWVLALRRRVGAQLVATYTMVAALPRLAVADAFGDAAEVVVLRAGAPGLYHLSGCALVRGRAVQSTTREAERSTGRTACGACGV